MFYFSLGKQLVKHGFKSFDHVSVYTFLEDKVSVKEHFERLGGYRTVEEIRNLVNVDNIDAYFDKIIKMNTLMSLHQKGFNVLQNISKFNAMTNQEVYDYYDYQLNNISINTGHDIEIETLEIDDKFIEECDKGNTQGIGYSKVCKILNYLTMGVPLGEMFMIGGYSGVGKSSFTFENMIIPMTENGTKCAVISNEQRSKDFKMLLLVHILTQDLDFWELTRKKIKLGSFTEKQREMLNKAKAISREKYGTIKFIKLFDNDMNKVKRIIKKLGKIGYQVMLFDTMKSEDEIDTSMWEALLMNSRKLFQTASKENIGLICTYQLALHTLNKRYLDASCLSSGKQVKEIFSEMVYLRPLWDDEFTNEKFDCKAYQMERDETGKYLKVKKMIDLKKGENYIVAFLDKSRNDMNNQQILYLFDGKYNKWREVGFVTIINDHK